MATILRPFVEKDFAVLLSLADEAVPFAPEDNRHWLYHRKRFDEARLVRRHYIAEDADLRKPVGYGAVEQHPSDPGRFRMFIVTHPARLRGGIGDLLSDRLMQDLDELNTTTVWAREYQQDTDILTFFQERGFAETHLVWDLRLPVWETDLASLSPVLDESAERGIVVTTLSEERTRTPDYVRHLHELSNVILADTSGSDQFTPSAFDDYVQWLERPDILPDAFFIASHDDRYIGLCVLKRADQEPKWLVQSFAGVRRAAYGEDDVVAALKVRVVEYAQQGGYRTIVTLAPDDDAVLLALNERLGFHRHCSYVTLEKKFVTLVGEDRLDRDPTVNPSRMGRGCHRVCSRSIGHL